MFGPPPAHSVLDMPTLVAEGPRSGPQLSDAPLLRALQIGDRRAPLLIEGDQRFGSGDEAPAGEPRVKGLLEIARLDTIFVVCADEAAALATK